MRKLLLLLSLVSTFAQRDPIARFSTIAEMANFRVTTDGTIVVVGGYYANQDGGGGTFLYSLTNVTTTNRGINFKPTAANGRFIRQLNGEPISVKMFGARSDGVTDDIAFVTNAINTAISQNIRTLVFPPGTTLVSSTIYYTNNLTFQGAGQGVSLIKFTGTNSAAFDRLGTNSISDVYWKDLTITGVDGVPAIGIKRNSVIKSGIDNVTIKMFRTAAGGDTNAMALYDLDSSSGNYYSPTFNLTTEDSDYHITQDGANALHATGYHEHFGLKMLMGTRDHGLRFLRSVDNGGVYNKVFGLKIQHTTNATGRAIYIEGIGNQIDGVIHDQSGTNKMLTFALTNTTGNYVRYIGGFDETKFVDNQVTGAGNVVESPGYYSFTPGKPRRFIQTETYFTAPGMNPSGIYIGNDVAGPQMWRLEMQGLTDDPYLNIAKDGLPVYIPNDSFHNFYITGVLTNGVQVTQGSLAVKPGAIDQVEIANGSVVIGNDYAYRAKDTNGIARSILKITTANGVQVLGLPTGSVQILGQNTNAIVQIFGGNARGGWNVGTDGTLYVSGDGTETGYIVATNVYSTLFIHPAGQLHPIAPGSNITLSTNGAGLITINSSGSGSGASNIFVNGVSVAGANLTNGIGFSWNVSGTNITLVLSVTNPVAKGRFPAMWFAVTAPTEVLTTSVAKFTIRAPAAFTIASVRAALVTASSSGVVTVDINKTGSGSILSTKLTLDANEKTSLTAATPPVISDTTATDDVEYTIDIDTAGTGAAGLSIAIYESP